MKCIHQTNKMNNKVQVVVVVLRNKYNTNKVFRLEMAICHIMRHRYRYEIFDVIAIYNFKIQFLLFSNYVKVQKTALDRQIPTVLVTMSQSRHQRDQGVLTQRNNKPKKRKLAPRYRLW